MSPASIHRILGPLHVECFGTQMFLLGVLNHRAIAQEPAGPERQCPTPEAIVSYRTTLKNDGAKMQSSSMGGALRFVRGFHILPGGKCCSLSTWSIVFV